MQQQEQREHRRLWSLQGVKLKFSHRHKRLQWSNATNPAWHLLVWIKVNAMWPTVCTPWKHSAAHNHIHIRGRRQKNWSELWQSRSFLKGQPCVEEQWELQREQGICEQQQSRPLQCSCCPGAWLCVPGPAHVSSARTGWLFVKHGLCYTYDSPLSFHQNLVLPPQSTSSQPKPSRRELGVGCVSWSTEKLILGAAHFSVTGGDREASRHGWGEETLRTCPWASRHSACFQPCGRALLH